MKNKKFLCAFFALVMLFAAALPLEAFADGPDVSGMTTEELHALINAARNELTARELSAGGETVLFDQGGVKVYLTGNYSIESYDWATYIYFEAVVINDTDATIDVYFISSTVNGWDVNSVGIGEITAGHKKKGTFELTISDAEINSYEEIEDAEFVFYVMDNDTWDRLFETDSITVHF